jgi:integrase
MSIAWENTSKEETLQFSADPIINDKVKLAVKGLWQPSIQKLFLEFQSDQDKELVADFILACVQEENIAVGTKRAYLIALARLASHVKKHFDVMTSQDLKTYLNSMQRDREQDPDQSWIRTQRAYGVPLFKFFKWLAYPEMTPHERRRHLPHEKLPSVLKGVVLQVKRGSRTPVKNKDLWSDKDTAIFLRYCMDNRRLRFYHALAIETSGRPGELLQLKIGDINIETDLEGKLYATLEIGRYGKRKEGRIVGITEFTIQYYQEYLPLHPDHTNKDAFIFISREPSAHYRNVAISPEALRIDYKTFRDKIIPKLLKRPDIPDADKKHLQKLREHKRWNPYIMRHTSIDKLSGNPNVNDYVLRQHAGWSKRSNMVEVYTHELKGDSLEHVMLAYGVNIKQKRDKTAAQLREEMVGPHCPFCHKVNIPGSLLCVSCQRPVSVVSYDSMTKELDGVKRQFQELQQKQDEMIKTATSMQRLDDFISQYSDENLPSNIETMIWEFLDPEEDGTVSKQERMKRQHEFPELVKAAKRLQKLRLATSQSDNKKRKRK